MVISEISFIIPVYNRPGEVDELLKSLYELEGKKDFEVVIVEDGSTLSSEDVIKKYSGILNVSYFKKENTGPGDSRNYGMRRARGLYFIILDSDCILPKHYLEVVIKSLKKELCRLFWRS